MYSREFIRATPAITVATVLTTGTNRAIITVSGPYRSKNSCDRCTCSGLSSLASLRLNTFGPTTSPM